MFYPEEFKKKVKKVFPDFPILHNALDTGSIEVGMLIWSKCERISYSKILNSTSLEELKQEAAVYQQRVDLYKEWDFLYQNQNHCNSCF